MPLYAKCPFCLTAEAEDVSHSPGREQLSLQGILSLDCPICGQFCFADTPKVLALATQSAPDAVIRPVLSHRVRQMTLHRKWPLVTVEIVQRAEDDATLPTPTEQLDNLILFLGDAQEDTGLGVRRSIHQWTPIIGARSGNGVRFLFVAAEDTGLAERTDKSDAASPQLRLTFTGWQRFEDLKRARGSLRRALMAMPFGNALFDRIFDDYFRPTVAQTGFDLFRVDELPEAGSIDDRIRVAIRTSRFVVAELTNDNSGAYWESGFAEGLGRPVIYTCERAFFEDPGTHFDTQHLHTVIWAENELEDAAERLKASIRATLPEEAILEDLPAGQ